ncbi:diguanylate cyclase [Vibrio maritimus]|uniref:Diguanylate cyclase n=1 Tax=Vibrio maritimus TaxID=990268 RepID=A0A090S213_9VIBR|nr:diguanylate cyclase [Vibrio maritimus]
MKMLIVDDDDIQLTVLSSRLAQYGAVTCANSAAKALQLVKGEHYDIILFDVDMPEMDGIEFIVELGSMNVKSAVVICTGMGDAISNTIKIICKRFSFSTVGHLRKPYKDSQLVQEISRIRGLCKSMRSRMPKQSINGDEVLLALANREIKNYYQPKVRFADGKVIGFEVLARWIHPIKGFISPAEFLPHVERLSLDGELFDVILRNTIQDYEQGKLHYPVAININDRNLLREDFTDSFLETCQTHGVDPCYFTFELTEAHAYVESVCLLKNLARLRLNGIGISIDDFGTGSSSLTKLSSIPFTEIKIDRGFVKDCTHNPSHLNIVKTIRYLSQKLELRLVAEGVEDEVVFDELKRMGIEVCQGFLTGKPMPIEAVCMMYE